MGQPERAQPAVPGYELVRRIGRGGAGEVFEAVRVGPGGFRKAVALKRLIADQSLSGRARTRFLEEARLTAQLEHANLVHLADGMVLSIAPDSRHVLVRSGIGDRITAVPVGAGPTMEIPHDKLTQLHTADWLPDGRVVVSGKDAAGVWRLGIADLVARTWTPVGRDGLMMTMLAGGEISPDGTRVCVLDTLSGKRGVLTFAGGAVQEIEAPCATWVDQGAIGIVTLMGEIDRLDLATGKRTPWKVVPLPDVAGLRSFLPVWVSGDRYLFQEVIHLDTLVVARGLP